MMDGESSSVKNNERQPRPPRLFNPGLLNPQLHRFSDANSPSTTENHEETETGHQK